MRRCDSLFLRLGNLFGADPQQPSTPRAFVPPPGSRDWRCLSAFPGHRASPGPDCFAAPSWRPRSGPPADVYYAASRAVCAGWYSRNFSLLHIARSVAEFSSCTPSAPPNDLCIQTTRELQDLCRLEFQGQRGVIGPMAKIWLAQASLACGFFALCGCRSAPQREEQPPNARTTINTTQSSQPGSTPSDENCGLDDFPVSKPNKEILAAVPRDMGQLPNQDMVAKVAIDTAGRVTHLRVLRLTWPKLANSYSINEQALESIKRLHQAPTVASGKPVAVCSNVSVTVDLQ